MRRTTIVIILTFLATLTLTACASGSATPALIGAYRPHANPPLATYRAPPGTWQLVYTAQLALAVADQDFRNDAVDAGQIGAGHTAAALYAVQLQPGAQGRLATAPRYQLAVTVVHYAELLRHSPWA